MNRFTGTLKTIKQVDTLHQLSFSVGKQRVHLLTLELNSDIKIGNIHQLGIKSTDIAIAKNLNGLLSYLNQLKARVVEIRNGALLSSVILEIEGFRVESIVPYQAVVSMDLQIKDEVVALIRGSEISVFHLS